MSKSKKRKKKRTKLFSHTYRWSALRSGEMLEALEDFDRASFAYSNDDVAKALEWTEYNTELGKVNKKSYKAEKHSGFGRHYPGTPMIDDRFKLSAGEDWALQKFKLKKPFQATKQEWLDLLQQLFIDLASAQGCIPPAVMHTGIWEYQEDVTSFYTPHVVVLTGARSLITALHEYIHSAGFGEVVAVRWSTNAFKLTFPKSFAKLEQHPNQAHLLRRKKKKKKKTVDSGVPENADIIQTDLGD